jgi:transposase
MSREKSIMELRDILNRIKLGYGIKQIHRETGAHRTVIRQLRDIAKVNGWLVTGAALPTEKDLYKAYYGVREEKNNHPLKAYKSELERYTKEGFTYVVMHELIRNRFACSESTVRRYVQAHIENMHPRPVVIRERELSVMEVDFGRLGIVYDGKERRNRVAYVFSGRLRFSVKAYRAIVFDQKQETFWECHIRAFDYFGGVPERVVPDNLKAAVVKASFTDPIINRGYRELAEHYGFLIDPCQPYHPEHKGGVENDIKYVKRNFYPVFLERQRQKGREVPLADECQPSLRAWEREKADVRVIKGIGVSPNELFEREAAYLKALPAERFDTPTWMKCTVSPASRIHFDRCTYTVPERLLGKEVMVAAHTRKIRVFYDHELVTEHERSQIPFQDIKKPEHLSERALAYMEHTKEMIISKASAIGSATGKVITLLLEDKAVSRSSSAWGIITLSKKYGNTRVEAACRRALFFDAPRYDTVKRILTQNLDTLHEKEPVDSHGQRLFAFARQAGYFNISITNKE